MKRLYVLITGLLLGITGCGPNVERYAGKPPELDIREYLNGNLEAWGGFISRSGKADTRFYVKLEGKWQGNTGILSEHFLYTDGRTKEREWHLQFIDDHNFTATAADVVGVAHGKQYGNSVNMQYVLQIPMDGTTYNVSVDDWLYKVDSQHLINHADMSKFGYTVGALELGFRKIP